MLTICIYTNASLYIYRYYSICRRHNTSGSYKVHTIVSGNYIYIRCGVIDCNSVWHALHIHHPVVYDSEPNRLCKLTIHPNNNLACTMLPTRVQIVRRIMANSFESTQPVFFFDSYDNDY